uniref:Amino acid permease 3-like n=1 Tax=Tanacetum cinerariifolium TaxID=118510 RepID=A0A6L2LAZ1_TANCI|nr:amino acid permease 3-like [Tanacetum cinerariifolium]
MKWAFKYEVIKSFSGDRRWAESLDEDLVFSISDDVLPNHRLAAPAQAIKGIKMKKMRNNSNIQQNPHYGKNYDSFEPSSFEEASKDPNWIHAMNDEMHALYENDTWCLTDIPTGRKPIGSEWVFRIKYKSDGEIDRYQARLVAKGFGQKEEIDYEETFSLVFSKRHIGFNIAAFFDSDSKCPVTRRSVFGYCVFANGSFVSWKSKKQATLSKSSAEAEYRSMAVATCEVTWIVKIMKDMGVNNLIPTDLYCDNKYAIQIAANPVMYKITKHFDTDVLLLDERHDTMHYWKVEARTTNGDTETHAMNIEANYSKSFDDDGRLKRTGTYWTASSHIITAVIGSGVLSLAWAVGQLGWIAGPTMMILFALVILYTSNLLAECYRSGDPVTGPRSYTYMEAVKAHLGGKKVKICGMIQYINLFGVAIGYTIAASVSMMAIKRSNCFHKSHGKDPCHMSSNGYMITFETAEHKEIRGSLTGISIGSVTSAGTVTPTQKLWRSFQALGAIAFAYSYSIILIEIQDTIKSPPAEYKTMKKATYLSIFVTTTFYILCGCMGYAAFGDKAPGNLLTGFGFYNPYWLLDIANVAIVVHLVGAYQVYCQPLFAFVEKWCAQRWSKSDFVTAEYDLPIPFYGVFQVNFFRVVWRTIFVMITTVLAMLLPFFNDVVGLLGALGFWPLTVYFPIEMYMSQKKIKRWSSQWIGFQILSLGCLLVSVAAAVGSIAGVVLDLKTYKPFKTSY